MYTKEQVFCYTNIYIALYAAVKRPMTTQITIIMAAATVTACKSVMIIAKERRRPVIFAASTAIIWNIEPIRPALRNESNMRNIIDASIRKYATWVIHCAVV